MKRDDCAACAERERRYLEQRAKFVAALERLRDQVNAALLLVEAELAEREQKASPVE